MGNEKNFGEMDIYMPVLHAYESYIVDFTHTYETGIPYACPNQVFHVENLHFLNVR